MVGHGSKGRAEWQRTLCTGFCFTPSMVEPLGHLRSVYHQVPRRAGVWHCLGTLQLLLHRLRPVTCLTWETCFPEIEGSSGVIAGISTDKRVAAGQKEVGW